MMRWSLLFFVALPFGALQAAPEVNLMHPEFVVRDAKGALVRDSGRPPSTASTCMACHDTAYIREHDSHALAGADVDCLACHVPGGRLPVQRAAYDAEGRLKRAHITLSAPTSQQCASCHMASQQDGQPMLLPEKYIKPDGAQGAVSLGVTRFHGTVWSGQPMAASGMNLQGKAGLQQPWDVHAGRGLQCSDCHAPASRSNDADREGGQTGHLWRDPRKRSTAQSLRQPDHRLRTADCLACHTVEKAHTHLPYASRHMEKLACQACHVPALHAPMVQEVDLDPGKAAGPGAQVWRNLEGGEADAANVRYVRSVKPQLLPYPGQDASAKIRPVNLVLERGRADGKAGIRVRVVPVAHGIQGGKTALRSCVECHGASSRLVGDLPVPGLTETAELVDAQGKAYPQELAALKQQGGAWVVVRGAKDDLALPGQGRSTWSTLLGFIFFLLTAMGVAGHALWRVISARRRPAAAHAAVKRVYLYSAYERLWHWLMAFSTLLLVLTGFEVHFTATFRLLGFANAVKAHNALAVLLLANAFLSLFYHLATSHILQFFPKRDTLRDDVAAQVRYYLQGIFEGAPHPSPKGLANKLNVLQQLTYMALLNVMLPFQAITGALMWAAGHWPQWSASLVLLTPMHNLGSWLFLSFTVGHVYLTTTGHTLTSNLKAMVDGYDQVEEP